MDIKQLDLIVPDLLPIQNELSEANKEKILLSLNLAMESLESDCQEKAISKVDRALVILSMTDILPANFHTQNEKKHREALDYDRYFNINRVQSKEPEICLMRSVLVVYKSFLGLTHENNKDNFRNIEIQRQGFKSYFQLISRVFNLSLN